MAILCIFLYLLCIWRWFKIKSKEVKTNNQTPNKRLQWLTAESSWTSLLPHLALLVTTFISLHSPLAGTTPVTSSSFNSMSNSQMGFHVKVFTFSALLSPKYTFLSSQGSVFLFIQLSVQLGHIRLFYFLHYNVKLSCLPICYLSFFSKCKLSESKDIVFFTPIYPTARILPGA